MNIFSHVYTLTESSSGGGGLGGLSMILMIAVLLLVMYFFMIRPQRKQERETNAMRNGLQVGDEITTIGGIIGKIVSIKGETCTIETGKARTKIRILKSAVKCVDVPASVANGGAVPAASAAAGDSGSADSAGNADGADNAADEPAADESVPSEAVPEVPDDGAGKKGKKKPKKSE